MFYPLITTVQFFYCLSLHTVYAYSVDCMILYLFWFWALVTLTPTVETLRCLTNKSFNKKLFIRSEPKHCYDKVFIIGILFTMPYPHSYGKAFTNASMLQRQECTISYPYTLQRWNTLVCHSTVSWRAHTGSSDYRCPPTVGHTSYNSHTRPWLGSPHSYSPTHAADNYTAIGTPPLAG